MIERAYAKVNLFLNVKNKREDGYHELEMVNITVGLYDELSFEITNGDVETSTSDKTLNGSKNLASKVAVYLKKKYNIENGVKIYIEKNIPVGGGLAGGSADAAATLIALNKLWNLNLSFDDLLEIGSKFGADIPYCLYKGPAVVTGYGNIIEPINVDISGYEIALFSPKVNVSTGLVFSALEEKDMNTYPLEEYLPHLKSNNYCEFIKGLKNSMQEKVFNLYPEVKKKYELLKRVYGEDGLFMTGSGSTIVKITQKTHN